MTTDKAGVLLSINVGMPQEMKSGDKTFASGIVKRPVKGAVTAFRNGLPGDGQADRVHHGGPDRVVCVYTYDHRPHWESRWNDSCDYGAFGENFSISGGRETDVRIGDIWRVGTAVFQVTQPRMPCYKLAARHGRPELTEEVLQTGFTGFYLRVIEEGEVRAGDEIVLAERSPSGITIAEAVQIAAYRKRDQDAVRRLLAADGLSADWRNMMAARLAKLESMEAEGEGT